MIYSGQQCAYAGMTSKVSAIQVIDHFSIDAAPLRISSVGGSVRFETLETEA